MFWLLILGVSCGLCLVIMPVVQTLASRNGLVDRPDGRRKMHARPIPLAGGLAVLMSVCSTLGIALLLSGDLSESLHMEGFRLFGLLLAAVTICAIGVADDYGRLRGRHKLLGQIMAAFLLIQFGWVIRSIHFLDWNIELGILAVPFTIVWLLGAINSLNLIDGMDGLLGSVGFILCAALAGMAVLEERWATVGVAVALAGALLGFLRYNFPPAKVFLGDSGSMLIGLIVGVLAIPGGLHASASVPIAIPIAFLTIPFFDTAAAIIRRKLTGRSIYTTDRGHLHHCLLRRGYGPWGVLIWVGLFCLTTSAGGLASILLKREWIALACSAFVIAGLIATRMFGYAEYGLLRDRARDIVLSLLRVPAQDGGRQMVVRLQGSVDWAELWTNFIAGSEHLNLVMIRLNVNAPALHEGYHARWDNAHDDGEDKTIWRADIPLMVDEHVLGRLEVIGLQDHEPVRDKMDGLLKLVEYFEAEASDLIRIQTQPLATDPVGPRPEMKAASIESISAKT
jgi:UDP-GlcNAc:undecaprenyl-phosphate GlcNAc-1-phosphate transferase